MQLRFSYLTSYVFQIICACVYPPRPSALRGTHEGAALRQDLLLGSLFFLHFRLGVVLCLLDVLFPDAGFWRLFLGRYIRVDDLVHQGVSGVCIAIRSGHRAVHSSSLLSFFGFGTVITLTFTC
jgi:hypothetical protein